VPKPWDWPRNPPLWLDCGPAVSPLPWPWAGAGEALRRFVEATATPAFTIDLARGLLSDAHPLCFGYADANQNATAGALAQADFVLIVGKRVDFRLGFGSPRVFHPDATLAQVDIRAEEFGRNRPVQIPVLADARAALEGFTAEAGRAWPEKPWVESLRQRRAEWRESWRAGERSDESPIHPLRLCREVRELISDDMVLVFDGGDWPQWPRMTLEALYVPVVDTKVEIMEGDTPEEQALALARRLKEAKLI